jgi:putative transposase
MPRNARCVAPGVAHHITQRGTDRQKVFFSVADRHLYLRLVRDHMEQAGVGILAWCLMRNHVHLVAVPEREDSLAVLFRRVHGLYSQAVNIRRGRCGHLWQARFYSCALSEQHLWTALRYVEANAVRAGLVEQPEAYRWSSAAVHLLGVKDKSEVLDLSFWTRAGGVERWRALHGEVLSGTELQQIRQCTYSGRPFGDDAFLSLMESRFDRVWRREARGICVENAVCV